MIYLQFQRFWLGDQESVNQSVSQQIFFYILVDSPSGNTIFKDIFISGQKIFGRIHLKKNIIVYCDHAIYIHTYTEVKPYTTPLLWLVFVQQLMRVSKLLSKICFDNRINIFCFYKIKNFTEKRKITFIYICSH